MFFMHLCWGTNAVACFAQIVILPFVGTSMARNITWCFLWTFPGDQEEICLKTFSFSPSVMLLLVFRQLQFNKILLPESPSSLIYSSCTSWPAQNIWVKTIFAGLEKSLTTRAHWTWIASLRCLLLSLEKLPLRYFWIFKLVLQKI